MDNIPPPLNPAYPLQPIDGRNWWQRNWKWFVPTGCVSLLLLLALFVGGIMVFVLE